MAGECSCKDGNGQSSSPDMAWSALLEASRKAFQTSPSPVRPAPAASLPVSSLSSYLRRYAKPPHIERVLSPGFSERNARTSLCRTVLVSMTESSYEFLFWQFGLSRCYTIRRTFYANIGTLDIRQLIRKWSHDAANCWASLILRWS